ALHLRLQMPVEITLVRNFRQVSIGLFRLVEEGQCFRQCGFTTRAFAYMLREYGKTLIGLLSPYSYNCLGVCSYMLVFLCLYLVMYRCKPLKQVVYRCFRLAAQ